MRCSSQAAGRVLFKKYQLQAGYGVYSHKMYSYKKLTLILLALLIALLLLVSEVPDHLTRLQKNPKLEQLLQLHNCNFSKATPACPSYFSWIQRDLSPWKDSGISSRVLHSGSKPLADFRVVIVSGKLYVEHYRFCYQTRAAYTLWGLLMLLEEYPGLVPDLELMFSCGDRPQVFKKNYTSCCGDSSRRPPPLFSYCTTRSDHFDIVFPDWSFWGWPEVNIAPWSLEMKKIFSGAQGLSWRKRKPVAQWKGNTWMGKIRPTLLKCDTSTFSVIHQNWESEIKQNFSSSSLSDQCLYRYKVYVEGIGWSVSLKYIMSCGSTMLEIEPKFYEFYSRSLIPFLHFWPVSKSHICKSVKKAVQWGNEFPEEAETIGRCAQDFLKEQLTMDYIYQYMLHLLQSYAKLLDFKPLPPLGVEPMTLNSDLRWHEVTMPDSSLVKPPPCFIVN